MNDDLRIGFIGAGNIAQAIGFALINTGKAKPGQILVSAPSNRNLSKFQEKGISTTFDNGEVFIKCQSVFLAVKPQFLDEALNSIPDLAKFKVKLIISCLAGMKIKSLREKLVNTFGLEWGKVEVVRVMPNTALLVGAGTSLFCHEPSTKQEHIDLVRSLLEAGGSVETVPETLFNPLGAVCGSGPAFMFIAMEALADGAVKVGVPRDLALRMSAQTMLGAAQLLLSLNKHPAQLKDEVCSPGGTTIAGVHALEKAGFRAALISAVEATKARADDFTKKP